MAQDRPAYIGRRYARSHLERRVGNSVDLGRGSGFSSAPWVRLQAASCPIRGRVDAVLPLMAEGGSLPISTYPFRHAWPKVLEAVRRPQQWGEKP